MLEIERALSIIKEWNEEWHPRYFMSDFDDKEINAIETVFEASDCFVYLCDFHGEQAWTRWTSKSENGVSQMKEEVLCRLRRIARADNEDKYKSAVQQLKASTIWINNTNLQNWMNNVWLPQHKRWVWAFRANSFQVLIKTNNGIERQNKLLKHNYLRKKRRSTITQLCTILVEEFFPDSYKKYADMNMQYSSSFRTYLPNRPRSFVTHCMQKLGAGKRIPASYVQEISDGIVQVKGSNVQDNQMYAVNFATSALPNCECEGWQRNYLPCKHMFAAIVHLPRYSFNTLSEQYREAPYFTLDPYFLDNFDTQTETNEEEPIIMEEHEQESDVVTGQKIPELPLRTRGNHLSTATNCRDFSIRLKA
eukprot:gene4285-4854_t